MRHLLRLGAVLSGRTLRVGEGMRRPSPREGMSPQTLLVISGAEASDAVLLITQVLTTLLPLVQAFSQLPPPPPCQPAEEFWSSVGQSSLQCGVGSTTGGFSLALVVVVGHEGMTGSQQWYGWSCRLFARLLFFLIQVMHSNNKPNRQNS